MDEINLIGTWQIDCVASYVFLAALGSVVIRVILSFLKSLAPWRGWKNVWASFCVRFAGIKELQISGWPEATHPDGWTSFLLGWFELVSYPVLVKLQLWTLIGAWVGLKTLSSWSRWSKEPPLAYQYFLIGNALIFLTALWLAQHFVVRLS